MNFAVTLTFVTGSEKGQTVDFTKPARCVLGRGSDCQIRLTTQDNEGVSRYHCFLEIEPSGVYVRDMGSLNGTFINGRLIGKRQPAHDGVTLVLDEFRKCPLKNGDELRLGDSILLVHFTPQPNARTAEVPRTPHPLLEGKRKRRTNTPATRARAREADNADEQK